MQQDHENTIFMKTKFKYLDEIKMQSSPLSYSATMSDFAMTCKDKEMFGKHPVALANNGNIESVKYSWDDQLYEIL